MSRREQDALLALFNSFRPSRRVTAFDQLADGKVLLEVMHSIDATHFKAGPKTQPRSSTGAGASQDNWVLRMNILKRLYRLLLSYPINAPNAPTLSLSTLREPSFNSIARNPKSSEGEAGLLQICRLCVVVGAMGSENEKFIARIQALDDSAQSELMKAIEGVTATLPQDTEEVKEEADLAPPPSALREERDKLLQEVDELRVTNEQLSEEIGSLKSQVLEANAMHEDDQQASKEAARTAQDGANEVLKLRAQATRAEEALAELEATLEAEQKRSADLNKTVEELRVTADEVPRLREQLDESRQVEERLNKSENVIEKYKKKLEDSAGLRRQLRQLEDENIVVTAKNSELEVELRKLTASKAVGDNYRSQVEAFEKKADQHAREFAQLAVTLEETQAKLVQTQTERDRLRGEVNVTEERIKELEGPAVAQPNPDESLNIELEDDDADGTSKIELRRRIRELERELQEKRTSSDDGDTLAALEMLLKDSNKSRDRYQSDYLEANRQMLLARAKLENIIKGRGGNEVQTALALRQQLDEVTADRDTLLKDKQATDDAHADLVRQLTSARADLGLVDKDKREIISSAREEARVENATFTEQLASLKEDLSLFRERDRLHLEEIRRLMMDKIEMQTAGIERGQEALDRERRLEELRASLDGASSPMSAAHILDLQQRNDTLTSEVAVAIDKMKKMRAFIKNQDALFRAEEQKRLSANTTEAQKASEAQISALKSDLAAAKTNTRALDARYRLENQLILGAWHDLGARIVRDHVGATGHRRPTVARPQSTSWLGRQRRLQDDALFAR